VSLVPILVAFPARKRHSVRLVILILEKNPLTCLIVGNQAPLFVAAVRRAEARREAPSTLPTEICILRKKFAIEPICIRYYTEFLW